MRSHIQRKFRPADFPQFGGFVNHQRLGGFLREEFEFFGLELAERYDGVVVGALVGFILDVRNLVLFDVKIEDLIGVELLDFLEVFDFFDDFDYLVDFGVFVFDNDVRLFERLILAGHVSSGSKSGGSIYPPGGWFAPPSYLLDLYVDGPRQNLAVYPAGSEELAIGLYRPLRISLQGEAASSESSDPLVIEVITVLGAPP